MQFFTHETLTGSVALKTTRELRLSQLDASLLQTWVVIDGRERQLVRWERLRRNKDDKPQEAR